MRCDCHIHIVGGVQEWPQTGARAYRAAPATLERILSLGAKRQIGRFVIVQPSFYGDNNGLLLKSLDILGPRGRGVAVVEPKRIKRAMLDDMHARGVRGLRLNLYSPGAGVDTARLAALLVLAATMAWHVEVIAPLPVLARMSDLIATAPVPIVVDHYGLPEDHTPDSGIARAFLGLLEMPSVWMKLSAPYRFGKDEMTIKPDPDWLRALLEAAPDRCVWGSDWPHTPAHGAQKGRDIVVPYRNLDYSGIVDEFLTALPGPDFAMRVLIKNPARLYDFEDHA